MRILYVVHQFYPQFVSGTEQYVLALARAGRRQGHDVRVFTVDPDFRNVDPSRELLQYDYLDVPVTRYRFAKDAVKNHVYTEYHNPEVGPAFRELLADFEPEIVHFFHLRWVGIDRVADVEARGIPFVFHLMDFWFVCPIFLLLRPDGEICDGPVEGGYGCFDCVHQGIAEWAREPWAREQHVKRLQAQEEPQHDNSGEAAGYAMIRRQPILAEVFARANLVMAPSSTVRDVLHHAGARSNSLKLKPYGIDAELLSDLQPPNPSLITVGFVGTLAPHKGTDVLVKAFRKLPDEDLRLRIHGRFGDFPEFDEQVRELAAGDDRIEFCGVFTRAELGQVLSGLHMLVVPSTWRENTPFVCLEARAAGVPVIASELPGMAEAVPEGRGERFRVGDSESLAQSLRSQIEATRQRGGRRLDPDPTVSSIAEQFEDFVREYRALRT